MTSSFISPIVLTDLTIVKLTGTDAHSFLQGQITQDVGALSQTTAGLGAYCSPKGRVLATMVACFEQATNDSAILLITKADNAMAFVQRLRMFVLRAKVDIKILEQPVLGVYSNNVQQPYTVIREKGYIMIAAPQADNSDNARYWIVPSNSADYAISSEAANNPEMLQQWQALDILVGLPWVTAAISDTFIPQTINLDLINGISFTKGCYPGQEVVARSHYRGTIKRRAAYGTISIEEASKLGDISEFVGTDTYNAKLPNNPCGRVINIALTDSGVHLLMEVQLSDLSEADFRLTAADGPVIKVAALPYELQ